MVLGAVAGLFGGQKERAVRGGGQEDRLKERMIRHVPLLADALFKFVEQGDIPELSAQIAALEINGYVEIVHFEGERKVVLTARGRAVVEEVECG